MNKEFNAIEIQRNVVLAQILEPLAVKQGCTTRHDDLTHNLRLQHFQTCAVNTGEFYQKLAERFFVNGSVQPKIFMDLALDCLNSSRRQVKSKKTINHGIIKTMFPLVMSHLIHGNDVAKICSGVVTVLKNSSTEDAIIQNKLYSLGFQTSDKPIKKEYATLNCSTVNLYENYLERELIAPRYNFDPCWAQEFLLGFPTVLQMYQIAAANVHHDFVSATVPAYLWAKENTNHGSGMVADLCVAVNYLLLINFSEDLII